ncbi:MAG TPA: HlyD family efflux transporter periplasmic adaptor subunit, partial [Caulobacter sp.]|nr:HlyD family efflux transporter periplasmic adaptor subunit [Caulobacter sp.]
AIAQARASLDTSRTNLAKATIRSPVDGVVLARSIEPGQTVAASLQAPTLFVLAEDLTRMELQVDIDEADVGQAV